jgi:hypothetical protein
MGAQKGGETRARLLRPNRPRTERSTFLATVPATLQDLDLVELEPCDADDGNPAPRKPGTVLVGTGVRAEQMMLLEWAVTSGFRGRAVEALSTISIAPSEPTVLVFDETWTDDLPAASRMAWRHGIVPLAILGTRWTPDMVFAAKCADFARRPYLPEDMFARIRRGMNTQRRSNDESHDVLERVGLETDEPSRTIVFRGRSITLRRAEYDVLTYLARAQPRPVSQSEIVENVLGAHGSGATARNQVYELRRKLMAIGAVALIETLRGSGAYRIRCLGSSSDEHLTPALAAIG